MGQPPKATGTAVAKIKPHDRLKAQVSKLEAEIAKCLPPSVPSAKFIRTVQTAINLNPDLGLCDSTSVLGACMKAAADGLILDGREAALVVYNVNVAKKGQPPDWQKKAQYMPMIAGIIKRCRNSGELSTLSAHVVYEHDEFDFTLGDDERIMHKPLLTGDRGKATLVYSIAKLRDGSLMREVMTVKEIEQVRDASRAKDGGPWVKWWGEMARKTVMRRLSKRLPTSADVASLFEADNELYDMSASVSEHLDGEGFAKPKATPANKKAGGAAEKLRAATAQTPHDPGTGEVIDADFSDARDEPPPGNEADYGGNGDPEAGDVI